MAQVTAPRQETGPRYQPHTVIPDDLSYTQSREMSSSATHAPMATPASAGDARQLAAEGSRQPRRTSTSATADRRKKLATTRSPLQNLELTLDSMTKEEKRARVQAAEQRARERAAKNAQALAASPPVDDPATFRNPGNQQQPLDTPYNDAAIYRGPDTMQQAPPVNTRQQGGSYSSEPQQRPSAHHGWTQHTQQTNLPPNAAGHPKLGDNTQQLDQHPSGIPKRNLSFKDRAARNPIVPRDLENLEAPEHSIPAPIESVALNRTTSNKLRKAPPENFPTHRRQVSEALPRDHGPIQVPLHTPVLSGPSNGLPHSVKDKGLPAIPNSDYNSRGTEIRAMQPSYAVEEPVAQGIQRRATAPTYRHEYAYEEMHQAPPFRSEYPAAVPDHMRHDIPQEAKYHDDGVEAARIQLERVGSDDGLVQETPHPLGKMYFKNRDALHPGQGLYQPPEWLDEWNKAAVGTLSGPLLDVHAEQQPSQQYKAWWEQGKGRGSTATARLRKAEAFDGEYDDRNEPTRFKPQLYLKCGPLLRYCGIRKEAMPSRSQRGGPVSEREMWRGSIMIVTTDSASSYEIAPILRLFVQDIALLPPAPHQVDGDLPPEYVDPIAGHPKLGRRGDTLYVRPVEHLEEGKDLSRDETDEGLFESSRSPPDVPPADGSTDLPGSFASRKKRAGVDGEKAQKYKDVRGFQLHTERGYTFWRFNIEIELREKQQRIAYRINRGPSMAFWVPARGQTMNMMFHSCNGFSASVKPDDFSGPDPMWRDVLNTHQTRPFHVMIGGGDQIYNDCVADQCKLFGDWLDSDYPFNKHRMVFSAEMQNELEEFYLERYCMWFSQGLFGLAASQIPMVNMYDDHDIFDGYGSYPDHDMKSPVFSGLGMVAFKYYMLFQHQSIVPESENSEPSWILGVKPGPYIQELSRSVYVSMGGKTALLAVDCRTERTEHEVLDEKTWEKITSRLYLEVRRGQVEHLLVLLGVPIAYPRMVWLENILTSRLMDPVKALGRTGVFGKVLNKIDGGVEVLDDLNDHWTAKNHKQERSIVIEDLQDLAMDKSVRVTILSGDVHLAAVGQFYSNPQLGLAKHKDPRYMPNIISSAIVNTPPPDMLADVLNKRNKVHHFDKKTDESMIPIFQHGPDGKPRNNKRLLPHRNWCSIRQWSPGATPPPTPPQSDDERSITPPPTAGGNGLLRRFSFGKRAGSKQFDESHESVRGPRPPISGGLLRSLTRRNSNNGTTPPNKLKRSMSLGSADKPKAGLFGFLRRGSQSKVTEYEDDEDDESMGHWGSQPQGRYPSPYGQQQEQQLGLRGGAETNDEYSDGDDAHFSPRPPQRSMTLGGQPMREQPYDDPRIRPFHRTPTGLTTKQMKKEHDFSVDLEGGLDICLNVEVNPKDPTGITVPYRLLVPRLHYEFTGEEDSLAETQPQTQAQPSGFKRFLSFRKKPEQAQQIARHDGNESVGEQEQDNEDESTDAGTVRRRF